MISTLHLSNETEERDVKGSIRDLLASKLSKSGQRTSSKMEPAIGNQP